MIDVKQFIKNKINSYDDGTGYKIDTSDGSVVNDVLVEPLSDVLFYYQSEHDNIAKKLSLSDVSLLSQQEMDNIGNRYLKTRKVGGKSVGSVYIYYSTPRSVSIPEGTIFVSGNIKFKSTSSFSYSRAQMEFNTDYYPNYVAGPINIESIDETEAANIEALSQFTVSTNSLGSPVKIINHTKISGARNVESNVDFYNRIIRELYGKSLTSSAGINGYIKDLYPEITNIEVIGAGNPLMLRDISYNISDVNGKITENFKNVISGKHSNATNSKLHIAKYIVLSDTDPSSTVNYPYPEDFTDEFTDEEYAKISSMTDVQLVSHSRSPVLADFNYTVPADQALAILLLSGTWDLRDGSTETYDLLSIDEIGFSGNKLRLGKTKVFTSQKETNVSLKIKDFDAISAAITAGDITSAQALITSYTSESSVQNFAPVLQKTVAQSAGVRCSMTMSTNDNTANGEMAYATFYRRAGVYSPSDGFGLAWKKQPEFLLRLNANNYAGDTVLEAADKAAFLEYFQVAFSTVTGQLSDVANKKYWFYNVYLVDNDVLEDEVWVGGEQIVNQSTGRNQFLVAGKFWIEPNTDYTFKLNITEGLGATVEVNDTEVLKFGTRYPNYLMVGDYSYSTSDQTAKAARGSDFGIAVANTKNCEWYVSNLSIDRVVESFPAHLFKLNLDNFPNVLTDGVTIKWYGSGYDADSYLDANSAVTLAVYNYGADEWEVFGTHNKSIPSGLLVNPNLLYTYGISGILPFSDAMSYYIDSDNNINMLAIATNSGAGFPGVTDHTLSTIYVEVNSGELNGVHRGNAVDVYCNDPKNITESVVSIGVISSTEVKLKDFPAVSRYIQEILEVYVTDSGTGAVLLTLDPSEYEIYSYNPGTTYSSQSDIRILFSDTEIPGTSIGIKYRYWANGIAVNSYIVNSSARFPTIDYLAKISPPAVVVIDKLEFNGTATVDEVKAAIQQYFISTTSSVFDKTQFLQILQPLGITYLNIYDIEMTIREYNYKLEVTTTDFDKLQQLYILKNSLSHFYCSLTDLYGVTKVNV